MLLGIVLKQIFSFSWVMHIVLGLSAVTAQYLTMVGSKAVNDVNVIPECLLILCSDEWRLDPNPLEANPVSVIFSKEQVVRRHFTSHLDSFFFSSTNNKHLENRLTFLGEVQSWLLLSITENTWLCIDIPASIKIVPRSKVFLGQVDSVFVAPHISHKICKQLNLLVFAISCCYYYYIWAEPYSCH